MEDIYDKYKKFRKKIFPIKRHYYIHHAPETWDAQSDSLTWTRGSLSHDPTYNMLLKLCLNVNFLPWEWLTLPGSNSYSRDSEDSHHSWCHNKQDINFYMKTISLLTHHLTCPTYRLCAISSIKIFQDWDFFSVQKPWGDFTVNNKFVFVWRQGRPAGAIMFYRSNRDVTGIQKIQTQ